MSTEEEIMCLIESYKVGKALKEILEREKQKVQTTWRWFTQTQKWAQR